jgi:hypothetical protein
MSNCSSALVVPDSLLPKKTPISCVIIPRIYCCISLPKFRVPIRSGNGSVYAPTSTNSRICMQGAEVLVCSAYRSHD